MPTPKQKYSKWLKCIWLQLQLIVIGILAPIFVSIFCWVSTLMFIQFTVYSVYSETLA